MGRALVVSTSYPRFQGDPSGHFVEAQTAELHRAHGHVDVVALGSAPRRETRQTATVHWCGGSALFGWPGAATRAAHAPWRWLHAPPALARARACLRRLPAPTIAVAHWMVPCAWPLADGIDAPLVVHAHGGDVRLLLGLPKAARRVVLGAIVQRAEHIVFAAEALLEELLAVVDRDLTRRLCARSQVRLPPLQVTPRSHVTRQQRRATMGAADDEPLMLFAGRLIPGKGADKAIDAAAALRPHPRLVIIGSGPDRERLMAHARRQGVEVWFTGALPRELALDTIAAADVLVHPSTLDAAPSVIREARALNVPVVASPVGDVARWATRDAGIRVAYRDDELSAAIADVLRSRPPNTASRYSW